MLIYSSQQMDRFASVLSTDDAQVQLYYSGKQIVCGQARRTWAHPHYPLTKWKSFPSYLPRGEC